MIKLILSDLTGVVIIGGHKKLCKLLADKYNLDSDKLYAVIYTEYFNKFATNQISEEKAYSEPIKIFGLKETVQELTDMYLHTHTINQPMVDLFKSLKNNYNLVLLTKNYKPYLDWEIKEFGLKEIFSEFINTSEINLPKASRETLNYVLNKFKLKPEEILYIDDQEENLVDAREMGFKTIFYQDFEQVKNELLVIVE
ncbi:MAG: HAD-IA family hydrolase [Candidatus Magasanikiibacteriota bacterium]